MAQEFTPQYTFKEDRLNELKQLFPEAWEDGVFNVDTLKELIGEFSTDNTVKEHFGLNWVGKQDARKIAAKPPTGTLKPCVGEGVNEDSTENIFIEGDNLEVLKILRKSYIGKIKVIYIDPPYNTGNDFIYKDDFADSTEDYLRKTGEKSDEGLLVSNPKSSGKYHANWLSFIYPRLRLAKDLLKDDGIIYISIDDNELDNLKKISDEVFGEENFRGNIIRTTGTRMGSGNTKISSEIDYVLAYSKTDKFEFSGLPMNQEDLKIYDLEDEKGKYLLRSLRRTGGENRREDRPSMYYPVLSPDGDEIFPLAPEGWESRWVCGESTYKKLLDSNEIVWKKVKKKGEEKWQVYQKHYLGEGTKFASNLWNDISGNKKATRELNALFGGKKYFDHPKPNDFLKKIINISNISENDVIMDFFAGSGSTGQSVFELIEKDIKFILIQLPEKCEEKSNAFKNGFNKISDVTKQRLKIVAENVGKGLKVYKQSNSTIYKWQEFLPEQDGALPDLFSKMELAYKNPLQDGVTTQDFITEVILQEGFPLTAKQEEVVSGIFKITHEWVPYTLYATMLYSFKNTDFGSLKLEETDHFVCLDKAFDGNDALKQSLDNTCKLYTI
ncbi:site-specific DNA-methyltransferase [Tenacibaculum maritimum]|nr:site-specific DNA-methyltransferase [Tenacibaculum maritimum]MDB0603079.1 site-specific DNA-methyltransferase [Tenacibaculum maritimum]MDB0611649.1 site-specific DNA-methyltransferase [Tenacibaculum maritimum]